MPASGQLGWLEGVGGHRGACWGLAVDRRGRAWPWPWPAAASSSAATEPRQASVAGSGNFVNGEHTVVTARPRAWGVSRGAIGIHDGDAGGLQEKEQRCKGVRPRRPWRPRSGTEQARGRSERGDEKAREEARAARLSLQEGAVT